MKHRLFYTLLASFALIIFLGAVVNILIVAGSTRRAYAAMVRSDDQQQAERIGQLAAVYYREQGTLVGVDRLLELPSGFSGMPGRRMGDHMMMDPSRMGRLLPPVLIVGSDGTLYADSQGMTNSRQAPAIDSSAGVPIRFEGRSVGRVLVGSMIRPALEDSEDQFLGLVARSALISSLSTALVALLLGGILFRSIASPVEALASASMRIGAGELATRLPEGRKDELGELIVQFNSMAESLQTAEEWKRRIISDSAHELRTPVSIIQGELEMILEGVYQADRSRIESLYRETELMSRLINELGELAAVEGNRFTLNLQSLDLNSLVEDAVESLTLKAAEKQITVKQVRRALPEIMGDPQKLLQVLRNLITNALKAVPAGGKIEIYPDFRTEGIALCVDDSGPGIPEEFREKIFQRFYRLDSSRSRHTGGVGLGLSISAQIMRLHGGEIRVDQGRNGGARLTLIFPPS